MVAVFENFPTKVWRGMYWPFVLIACNYVSPIPRSSCMVLDPGGNPVMIGLRNGSDCVPGS